MAAIENIVILTGAGISAESGVPTFRSGPDSLWEGHNVQDVATPQAFARNPELVQNFYDMRRAFLDKVAPNAAHQALAQMVAQWPGELLLVTQNVDDLHERGGIDCNGQDRLLHMHGELKSAWCTACDHRTRWTAPLNDGPPCPKCGAASLRPDIVWFGEMPYGMDRIYAALARCNLFVSIGTSGAVYPAAGFVQEARENGAATLELNLEPSDGSHLFDESRQGPATQLVPAWVDAMLSSA